jgi:bisphosphoglycerate-dependent phosphoglycerate mutase
MTLDNLGEDEVAGLEVATAVPMIYELDVHGRVLGKDLLDDCLDA